MQRVLDLFFGTSQRFGTITQYYDENYICAPIVGGCSIILEVGTNMDNCFICNGNPPTLVTEPTEFDSTVSVTIVDTGEAFTGIVTGGSNCEVPKGEAAALLAAEADIPGLGRLVVNSYNVDFFPQFISVELHE